MSSVGGAAKHRVGLSVPVDVMVPVIAKLDVQIQIASGTFLSLLSGAHKEVQDETGHLMVRRGVCGTGWHAPRSRTVTWPCALLHDWNRHCTTIMQR